jgi:energy-coupling factor transporter ATP-binding protein EcfA2
MRWQPSASASAASRIMFRHLLPNAIAGSIVFSMSDAVLVLLSGAAISYLGLGVQPPIAEWGVMVAEGQSFITTAWWITLFPGLSIVVFAFGFSILGDGARRMAGSARMSAPVLSIRDLTVKAHARRRARTLIDAVSFDLGKGEILGLVGESGSGKSMICRSLVKLLPSSLIAITNGSSCCRAATRDAGSAMRKCAPFAAVRSAWCSRTPPVISIPSCASATRSPRASAIIKGKCARCACGGNRDSHPGRLSRSGPAIRQLSARIFRRHAPARHDRGRALLQSEILIADEPTTALDVTIQAQILQASDGPARQAAACRSSSSPTISASLPRPATGSPCCATASCWNRAPKRTMLSHPQHPYTSA